MHNKNVNLIIESCIQLGLSRQVAQIYECLLETENPNITKIQNATKLDRRIIANCLDVLTQKDLIKPKKNHSHKIQVESPLKLQSLLKYQEIEAVVFQSKLESFLPNFIKNQDLNNQNQLVKVHLGQKQFEQVFNQILAENPAEIRHIGDEQSFLDLISWNYYRVWIKNRIRKGIKVRDLTYPFIRVSESIMQDKDELRETKLLPKEYQIQGSIFLYNQKVIFWDSELPKLILIDDVAIYNMQSNLFEILWMYSK